MKTGKTIDVDGVTEAFSQVILSGIESEKSSTESMANLIARLERTADRLDPT